MSPSKLPNRPRVRPRLGERRVARGQWRSTKSCSYCVSLSVVPLALTSFYFAFTRAFTRHRKLNRFLLPIWLYVSLTGVVIFFMLRAATALGVQPPAPQ